MKKRVVITGIGVVSPIGVTTEVFWENCLLGNVNVTPIPQNWQKYHSYNSKLWSPLSKGRFAFIGSLQSFTRVPAISKPRNAIPTPSFKHSAPPDKARSKFPERISLKALPKATVPEAHAQQVVLLGPVSEYLIPMIAKQVQGRL